MTVAAPPRRPRPRELAERDEFDTLVEALIEEARQRARRRRRRIAATVVLAAFVGASLFTVVGLTGQSRTASPALAAGRGAAEQTSTSRIAFVRNHSENAFTEADVGLYTMNPDGSGERLLAEIAHHTGGAWSPDGRMFAFTRQRDDEHHGVYVVNADGSGLRRLTHGADGGPAWSPDGRKIAFVRGGWSNRDGIDRGTEIFVMNADGTGERGLTRNQAQDYGPSWSPDGMTIVFGSDRDGVADTYVMNADGSGQRRLLGDTQGLFLTWAPDGRRLVFGGVKSEIFLMNSDGSELRRVTRLGGVGFAWSPDGQEIAFIGSSVGWGKEGVYTPWDSWSLYVMSADGSGLRDLKGAPDWEYKPQWSPDGREIAFVSARDGNREIYVVNADTGGLRNVTRHPGADISPAWSPVQP